VLAATAVVASDALVAGKPLTRPADLPPLGRGRDRIVGPVERGTTAGSGSGGAVRVQLGNDLVRSRDGRLEADRDELRGAHRTTPRGREHQIP
jgi:hypothetical protein